MKLFDRINTKNDKNSINIISSVHIKKPRLNKMFKNSKADRIVIFFGTGWKSGKAFYDFVRTDGSIIKNGIEIIYVPYSEHSSISELQKFKKRM